MSALWGYAIGRGGKWLIVVRLLLSLALLARFMDAIGTDGDQHLRKRPIADKIGSASGQKKVSFQEWVQQTKKNYGMFLNHSSFVEGEVLLFRTKKSRHRAIPVMKISFETNSKFSDALTFKEFIRSWLHRVSGQEKALKVTIRTSEVVRPVLLHLYANKHMFQSPVILHANTFESKHSTEKAVDLGIFIKTVKELLSEAVISLGWTPSEDYDVINKLDWSKTFRLLSYIHELNQPVILTMKLNDAIHSSEPLNWLLGTSKPRVYLVLKGALTDFIDGGDDSFVLLTSLAQNDKVFFDVDDSWKRRLADVRKIRKKKRSIEPEKWTNLVFPNPYGTLSGMTISDTGVAFLGWPNALLVSNESSGQYPNKQKIGGKVLFLPKRHIREIAPLEETGMLIELFEGDATNLKRPTIDDSIKVFIGYNGHVSIENSLDENDLSLYHQSTSGQLPKSQCYDFDVLDKGWRVEMEIWTTSCDTDSMERSKRSEDDDETNRNEYRTFLQLDTPISRTRKMRSVAIGKTGDGAVDFVVKELRHSSSIRSYAYPLLIAIMLLLGAIL